ncbi:A24 family peptidase [Methylobacterium currus]|uniref:prepilin peptidase n=1 Tax=Methylobacterium currus TaxID=2051553 RepID=UPI001E3BD555|nr:A24 family peptidase [Methylobacterium currus]UHC17850.1 A24 family peptidase [Methylobacterium currus]
MKRSWLRLLRDDGHDTGWAEPRGNESFRKGRSLHRRGLAPSRLRHLGLWATLAAVLGAGAAYAFGGDGPTLVASGVFAGLTMRIFATDIRLRLIYDCDIIMIYTIGILLNIFEINNMYLFLYSSILRSFLYVSLFFSVNYIYRKCRFRDAIGRGDMKLAVAIGDFVDLPEFPLVIALASLLTLAFGVFRNVSRERSWSRYTYLPFGAFFMASSYFVWVVHI